MATEEEKSLMREAIRLMREAGVVNKTGGPFGAIIAKDGKIVSTGRNTVISENDPLRPRRSQRNPARLQDIRHLGFIRLRDVH